MTIKGTRTIAEYKEIQKNRIQKWIDDRFISGSVTWEMSGASHIKITDKTGDSMTISLDEIEWYKKGVGTQAPTPYNSKLLLPDLGG